MEKIWKVKPANLKLQKEFSRALDISPLCAQILINRGMASIKEARVFLDSDLTDLHDPFLLEGMKKAVARIKKAIGRGEKIMVWGDYDIDGITGTCLLVSVLKKMGADVSYYLPNRLEEGYGLNKEGAKAARKKGVGLLITVDCGMSADAEISYLKNLGIDAIITDHHQPRTDFLPKAFSIINPLQKGCSYPYKYLAGVGVAAKLASALRTERDILDEHLDLITLGTIGDIVPLTGENRVLVKQGLINLRKTTNLGLLALMEIAGIGNREINARDIGYILGPRINASGRLGNPEDSLRLLLAQTELEACTLAQKLNKDNRARQRIESLTLQEAIEQVETQINFKEHNIIVLAAPHWHLGVIGIVASRLVERYLRPTIMMSIKDGFGRGSGRSIGNFHLLEAVTRCKDLLHEYGGHSRACGIKLREDNFAKFMETINRVAEEMLMPEDLIPTLEIDLQTPLANLDRHLIEQLSVLSPFGTDNPQPIFVSYGLELKSNTSIVARNHLKFWVTDEQLTCEAIGYNKAGAFPRLLKGQRIDLVYSPSINNWQGNSSIQLKIEDLRINSA